MTNRFDEEANGLKEQAVNAQHAEQDTEQDTELELALKSFKSSVHAWSDAVYSRPRGVSQETGLRGWRVALGWALGCVLVAASVSGGLLQRQHRQEAARIAAQQRAAEQQRQMLREQAAVVSDEVLLADVDSDVSRQVPSAMEPLAQMMDETK
jgi:hypothetical protein